MAELNFPSTSTPPDWVPTRASATDDGALQIALLLEWN